MNEKLRHEYINAELGHSNLVCKWCSGTPNENAVIGPNHCEARAHAATQGDMIRTISEILRDKGAGKRNILGDYWGDNYCTEAADTIDTLVEALEHVRSNLQVVQGAEMDAVLGPTYLIHGITLNRVDAAIKLARKGK